MSLTSTVRKSHTIYYLIYFSDFNTSSIVTTVSKLCWYNYQICMVTSSTSMFQPGNVLGLTKAICCSHCWLLQTNYPEMLRYIVHIIFLTTISHLVRHIWLVTQVINCPIKITASISLTMTHIWDSSRLVGTSDQHGRRRCTTATRYHIGSDGNSWVNNWLPTRQTTGLHSRRTGRLRVYTCRQIIELRHRNYGGVDDFSVKKC